MLLKVAGAHDTTIIFMGDIWKPRTQWESSYFGFVCGLTMVIGLYNSRGVLNKPPLEVLRREE
ncbi:MAG TPA: hypothetical protein VHE54_16830 [Puia sp.]|nr:hypothetical protein [Puia sp.]